VPNQQPQGQLQTQHSVDKSNYIWTNTTKCQGINEGKHWRKNTLIQRGKSKQNYNNNNNNNRYGDNNTR
jgi:hypothetical protein